MFSWSTGNYNHHLRSLETLISFHLFKISKICDPKEVFLTDGNESSFESKICCFLKRMRDLIIVLISRLGSNL